MAYIFLRKSIGIIAGTDKCASRILLLLNGLKNT